VSPEKSIPFVFPLETNKLPVSILKGLPVIANKLVFAALLILILQFDAFVFGGTLQLKNPLDAGVKGVIN
jgi:hypothetical protein